MTTSQVVSLPNREKMISRSSSEVTGLSLQTKSMFSSGVASAAGKSPIISSTTALLWASVFRTDFSTSSAGLSSSSGTHVSSRRSSSPSLTRTGEVSGTWASRPGGSSKGSSRTTVCLILMFCHGLPRSSQKASFILCTASMPSATSPKTVCFPSRLSRLSFAVM